jgi:carbon monoxide dehydrogenase subunit G
MKIEGSFRVAAPIETVWRHITDPDQVAPCLPGCDMVEVTGPNAYRATIRVALGPIKTSFNVYVELTEQQPPHFAASLTRGEEGGKASTLTAHNELRLRAVDGGATEVSYSSDVSLFGRLGKYGLGVMKKKAETLGREFAQAFSARVEAAGPGGQPATVSPPT